MPNLSVVSNTLVCTASVSVGCFRTFERQFLLFGHAKIGGGQEMEGGGLPQFLPSTPIFARPNSEKKLRTCGKNLPKRSLRMLGKPPCDDRLSTCR